MQPTYIPWVGYLAMIGKCDQFVFLDNVQYNHRSWQQRNRIKTHNGEEWLTLSTFVKNHSDQLIKDVKCIDLIKDIDKHIRTIIHSYSKASFYKTFSDDFFTQIRSLAKENTPNLAIFNMELTKFLCEFMGINIQFIRGSEIPVSGNKDELLANICHYLGANNYLSAVGSREYLDGSKHFEKRKIKIEYHHYTHPHYTQLHGEFLTGLSCIDMFFNVEREKLKDLISSGCL